MKTLKQFFTSSAMCVALALALVFGFTPMAHAQCAQAAGPDEGTATWSALYGESFGATCFRVTADPGSDLSFFIGSESTAATWFYTISGPDIGYLSTAGVPAGTAFNLDYANVAGGVYNGFIYFNGAANDRLNYGVAVTAVPEPSSYALMLAGLGVVGYMARRRRTALST